MAATHLMGIAEFIIGRAFARPVGSAHPTGSQEDVVWFVLSDRPLFAFASIWTEFRGGPRHPFPAHRTSIAAHPTVLLCFAHSCLAIGTATTNSYYLRSFRKEECCSMRVHFDEKLSDGVAIAFVVIALLTPFALAMLLSRLHVVF
jgi:hypothetical protein